MTPVIDIRIHLPYMLFSNPPPITSIATLSLHDALPIYMTTDLLGYPARSIGRRMTPEVVHIPANATVGQALARVRAQRSEEHTSELQSRGHLVCRLLLEKKKIS